MTSIKEKLLGYPSSLSVYEVSACPLNKSLWLESAANLGCNLQIGSTTVSSRYFYYCIPTESKSQLVEFCYDGISRGITSGLCLQLTDKGFMETVDCTHFTEGCPEVPYLPETVFNYPACLQVNTYQRCYLAEEGCSPFKDVITDEPTFLNSLSSSDPTSQRTTLPFSRFRGEQTSYVIDVSNTTELSLLSSSEMISSTTSTNDAYFPNMTAVLIAFIVVAIAILILILAVFAYRWKRRKLINTNKQDEEIPLHEQILYEEDEETHQKCINYGKEDRNINDIFGKQELWKKNEKCDGITKQDRLKLYRKLFWNKKEKTFTCTVEELLKHLDIPNEYENLESQDDNTDFHSEDSEKMTLWDFLHENGDISKNMKFWFAKSSDNSIIEKYCVSPKYSRQEKETAICIPSELLPEFVKKLDINIFKHRTLNDESIYPCVSDILKIPTEILYFGDDAVQKYLKQLKKGSVKVYHARGMIVGCAGAGKTTLLKKLKELPLRDILDTKSTRGVEIQADVFTVSGKEISGQQMTVTSEKVLTHFNIKESTTTKIETLPKRQGVEVSPDEDHANLFKSGLTIEQEISMEKRTNDSNDQSFVEQRSDNGVANKLSSENTNPVGQVEVQTGKDPMNVVEKRALGGSDENLPKGQEKEALEPIQLLSFLSAIKDDTPKTITIFDFAGQSAYYVTHQIYLSPRAFYILVIDMTKDLEGLVINEAVFIGWTYKELIQHWMKMIHAIHRSVPVILVATHAEGKSKEDIKTFFVQIWNLIPEDIQKCHLDDKHEFAVELDKSVGIAKIKESILNIVSNTKHWGEVRPSSWVMFENYLMKAKIKIKVMKMEDLWTENKNLHCEYQLKKKSDMKRMLQFFHDTGTILYFDEDVLRDDIILDVPWFVDAFKHIITDPVHATEDFTKIRDTFASKYFSCQKALDDLKQSGILPVSLVLAIWKLYENMKSDDKDASYDTYVQNMQGIMRYMERLGMITKITTSPEEMWYVPCMNKRYFLKEEFKDYSISSTVCFRFKFLPPSVYYRLIASCINLLGFTILRWPEPVYFYKNAVLVYKTTFDYKYYFLIGSVELQNTIEIQVLIEKGFEVDRKNSSKFKNEISDQLDRLTKTFHTNLEKFEIGYRCRNTIFSDKTAAHFIPESKFEETTILCPECKPPNRILCADVLYPWNKEGKIVAGTSENKISNQTWKSNNEGNKDVSWSVESQEVMFILETSLNVPGIKYGCLQISCVSSESAWVSDYDGRLRQVDKHGNVIKTVSSFTQGSHTVTPDGDLLFIDIKKTRVYRVAGEGEQILNLQTNQCELWCIFSSPRNRDLLIGGRYCDDRERGVVMRYNAAGDTRLQKIERDEAGHDLYTQPGYVTENMNGDIIVSDSRSLMAAVLIVVDKSGRHRFTYTGHPSGSEFRPRGVCTDTSGRILVCDWSSNFVHILTRNGEFLSLLQTPDHGIERSFSIGMNNKQRVWVGDGFSNRMYIYRYQAPQ